MPFPDLQLSNKRIINLLGAEATLYLSFKKMQTTCRQIKAFQGGEFPCPRWGHHILTLKDSLLVFGGYENSNYYNDLWKFDLATCKFTPIDQTGEVPPPCSNFTMNYDSYRNKVIVFGGGSLNKQKLNGVYELDLENYQWKQITFPVADKLPWQRSYHCAEIIDKYLVVFGGEFLHEFNDLWIFDTVKCKWREIAFGQDAVQPEARKFSASFVWQQKMYIVGGCRGKYQSLADGYCIDLKKLVEDDDLSTLQWEKIAFKDAQLLKRWGHVCVVKQDKAYVFGGRAGNKDLQNLVEINLVTNICQEIVIHGSIPRGRRRPGLCIRDNTLYCFSGFDGSYVKDFFYMPLVPRPHLFKKPQVQNSSLQSLRLKLQQANSQKLNSNFDKDIIPVSKQAYTTYLHYLSAQITRPIIVKDYKNQACVEQFANGSLYFSYLKKWDKQELQIYRPDNIAEEDYVNLIEIFVSYMSLGKIILKHELSEDQTKYLEYLLELAQYYCLDSLEDVIHRHKFQMFERTMNSKKSTLQQIAERAFSIHQRNQKHGEYASYFFLMKVIDKMEIPSLQVLKNILNEKIEKREKCWILEMVGKYSFELMQKILHQQQDIRENRKPLNLVQTNIAGKQASQNAQQVLS